MKIREINIIQFGKFKDRVWRVEDGMNVIIGDNESGKSTLLAFIKFALYGVGRKNPSIAVGERERAVSWNVGIAAGSLTVEDTDGSLYRIERSGRESARGAYADRARIIDLGSGEEVFSGEVPGEHFLGINAQAYDSMCNIKQLECVAVGGDAVKSVIDNLLSSGDENMNIQSALKALDNERRRLLHTNGKGGIVYETQTELEKLKSEHRSSAMFELECTKNRDELERVELALTRAQEEHRLAQMLCDAHDDIVRLHKFDTLRELRANAKSLLDESEALCRGAGFDTGNASYENLAEISAKRDALERSKTALISAREEADSAASALNGIKFDNEEGLSALIEEYGSPSGAVAFISAKRKKRSSSVFLFSALGIAGAVMLVLAAVVAFAMNNGAGGATVAFISAVLLGAAAVFFRQFRSADAEIKSFLSLIDDESLKNDQEKLLSLLESYSESLGSRSRLSNVCEGAKFRLSVALDGFDAELGKARSLLGELGVASGEGEEKSALDGIEEKMKAYLSASAELGERRRDNASRITSLSRELDSYSEKDLRERITPELAEKLKDVPFEELRRRRDDALKRTSQYSQYKAGIERNLALDGSRRAPSEIFPEIERTEKLLSEQRLRLDAVRLAMDTVNAASLELKSDITPRIREKAEKNLSAMTSGKYGELYINESMSLSVFADGATRPIDALSRGSLDVAYFSVRLSLIDTLLGDRVPPIFADEILSQLDEGRARGVVKALASHAQSAQCLLLTCRAHDLELAKSIADVNVIDLNSAK